MPSKAQAAASGWQEGVARALSQALCYVFEIQKTTLQVYGHMPQYSPAVWASQISRGVAQSSLTAGLVFHTYFSVYHALSPNWTAGPVAALATSVLKIPIGNCMRIVQSTPNQHPTIFHAARSFLKTSGVTGLYGGYFLCLCEDIIEMDLRIRVYNAIMSRSDLPPAAVVPVGIACGAFAGAAAAALTTPFDTLRTKIAFNTLSATATKDATTAIAGAAGAAAAAARPPQTGVQILGSLCASGGAMGAARALYTGTSIRAVSTGLRTAAFYGLLEAMKHANAPASSAPCQTRSVAKIE